MKAKLTSFSKANVAGGSRHIPSKEVHTAVGRQASEALFKDYNHINTSPASQQFEPTDNSAVRQHFKMAGGA